MWTIDPGAERTLRDLSVRNDIIKTMHRAMTRDGGPFDPSALALHSHAPSDPILGRLIARGLHDELTGIRTYSAARTVARCSASPGASF